MARKLLRKCFPDMADDAVSVQASRRGGIVPIDGLYYRKDAADALQTTCFTSKRRRYFHCRQALLHAKVAQRPRALDYVGTFRSWASMTRERVQFQRPEERK